MCRLLQAARLCRDGPVSLQCTQDNNNIHSPTPATHVHQQCPFTPQPVQHYTSAPCLLLSAPLQPHPQPCTPLLHVQPARSLFMFTHMHASLATRTWQPATMHMCTCTMRPPTTIRLVLRSTSAVHPIQPCRQASPPLNSKLCRCLLSPFLHPHQCAKPSS